MISYNQEYEFLCIHESVSGHLTSLYLIIRCRVIYIYILLSLEHQHLAYNIIHILQCLDENKTAIAHTLYRILIKIRSSNNVKVKNERGEMLRYLLNPV